MKAFKKTILCSVISATVAVSLIDLAAEETENCHNGDVVPLCHSSGISHCHGVSPIGINHMHAAGEWMLGYHLHVIAQGTPRLDGKLISPEELQRLGFQASSRRMDMHMHMFHFMYAPRDWLTIMLMPHYMEMTMEMEAYGPSIPAMSHGGHPGHILKNSADAIEEDPRSAQTVHQRHSHKSAGVSDTIVQGLIRLAERGNHRAHLGVGLSIPSGSINVTAPGSQKLTHYDMQLGSGTWDFLPSLTYVWQPRTLQIGTELGGVIRGETANSNGYRLGNAFLQDVWLSWNPYKALHLTGRVRFTYNGRIHGQYNKAHSTKSPSDVSSNSGGKVFTGGIGAIWAPSSGILKNVEIGLEFMKPIYERRNGIQGVTRFELQFSVASRF